MPLVCVVRPSDGWGRLPALYQLCQTRPTMYCAEETPRYRIIGGAAMIRPWANCTSIQVYASS